MIKIKVFTWVINENSPNVEETIQKCTDEVSTFMEREAVIDVGYSQSSFTYRDTANSTRYTVFVRYQG